MIRHVTIDDRSFAKGNKIYLHLLNGSQKNLAIAAMPGVHIQKAYVLKGAAISIKEDTKTIEFEIPGPGVSDSNDRVIVLEADKNVEDIPVLPRN